MRWTIPAFLMVASLLFHAAEAQPGRGGPSASPGQSAAAVCAPLRGATPGLLGLCQAYCAQRDQAEVNMNDIASVRAAAPNVKLLEQYNALRSESDPDMPCFADSTTGTTDTSPAPTSCACWTQDHVQAIDGFLDPIRGMTSDAVCTLNDSNLGIYEAQIYEGYNVGTSDEIVINSSFAYFDLNDSGVQGCMSESPTEGILNLTLQNRAEAQYCIQTIVDQCAQIGQ